MKKNKARPSGQKAKTQTNKIGALQSSYNTGNMAQESLRTTTSALYELSPQEHITRMERAQESLRTTSPLYELSPQEHITRMERAQQGYEEDERVVCTTCTCCIWMCILGWFSLCIF
jgi:hypothetical protein